MLNFKCVALRTKNSFSYHFLPILISLYTNTTGLFAPYLVKKTIQNPCQMSGYHFASSNCKSSILPIELLLYNSLILPLNSITHSMEIKARTTQAALRPLRHHVRSVAHMQMIATSAKQLRWKHWNGKRCGEKYITKKTEICSARFQKQKLNNDVAPFTWTFNLLNLDQQLHDGPVI